MRIHYPAKAGLMQNEDELVNYYLNWNYLIKWIKDNSNKQKFSKIRTDIIIGLNILAHTNGKQLRR
jgi:hypothetical protein